MRLERLEFSNPVFAVLQGAGDRDEPLTYSFGERDPFWTGGWYGMSARAAGDEWSADRDPAAYMRPVAEYEIAFTYEQPDDLHDAHGSFSDTQTYAWSDDLNWSFNAAAEGRQERPAARAGEEEDEKAGTHAAGPGQHFGPGRPH